MTKLAQAALAEHQKLASRDSGVNMTELRQAESAKAEEERAGDARNIDPLRKKRGMPEDEAEDLRRKRRRLMDEEDESQGFDATGETVG